MMGNASSSNQTQLRRAENTRFTRDEYNSAMANQQASITEVLGPIMSDGLPAWSEDYIPGVERYQRGFEKNNLEDIVQNNSDDEVEYNKISNQDCIICMDEKANCLFQPCNHLVACMDCAQHHSIRECPMCRTPITSKRDITTVPISEVPESAIFKGGKKAKRKSAKKSKRKSVKKAKRKSVKKAKRKSAKKSKRKSAKKSKRKSKKRKSKSRKSKKRKSKSRKSKKRKSKSRKSKPERRLRRSGKPRARQWGVLDDEFKCRYLP